MSLLETSLLFFSLVSVTVQQLVIKPSGDSLIKSLRSSMVITCSILNSDTNVDVKWLDTSGVEVTNRGGGRVYLEVEGATKKLYITSIIKSDAGRYTCIGNLSGILQERSIRLVLFQDITFDVAPAEQHPQIYTDALIHCEVSANPPPTVTWKFNRQKLHMGGRFSQVADGLRITNISQSDNGEYVCCAEVESAGRFDERAIVVSVHIPPKILSGPGKSEGIKGRQFTMSCSADSFPLPDYRFYKINGNVKDPVLSTSRINVNASHGTIHFLPLSKSDEGIYLCTAFNDVGNDSASGEIRVLVPTTIINTSSIVTTEGESVTLFCQAEGDPMPGLEFGRTRTGMPYLRGDNEGGKIVVSSPSEGVLEMLIKDVTPNDAGNYSCFARNAIEEDIRQVSLTVEFKPRFLVDQKRVTYIWADTTRSMSCHFEGVPAPSVEWLQGRRPIRENETYQVSTSRRFSQLQVHVREVDQGWIYGDYTCKIKNYLGEADMTIDLRRATIPDAPTVTVKKCLPTEVVLDVIAPEEDGGVEILGYIVEYLGKPEDFNIGTEVRVQNLSPGTTYQLTVRARNEVGLGTPVQVPATTKTICEPYPVNIVSKPEGSEAFQYRIAWQVVSNGGMDITEYQFKYRKVIDDRVNTTQKAEVWTTKIVEDDPNHRLDFLLEDLDPNCRYELEIRAKNPMGWSRPSQTFFFRTFEASPADMEKYRPMAADSLTLLIPVIVIGIFIILLTIDIVAYKLCGCGITSCICVHLCHRKGRDRVNAKNSDGRDGDEKPLSEFEKNNDRDSTVECKTWEYAEKERLKNHKSLRDNQPVPV